MKTKYAIVPNNFLDKIMKYVQYIHVEFWNHNYSMKDIKITGKEYSNTYDWFLPYIEEVKIIKEEPTFFDNLKLPSEYNEERIRWVYDDNRSHIVEERNDKLVVKIFYKKD